MEEKCKVIEVIVNLIPKSCGDCPLMVYLYDSFPVCMGLPQETFEITGNPYEMTYRRSDCPLREEKESWVPKE